MRNLKNPTLKTFEAVSILIIFGGLVLTPSAALLSQYFPKVNLEPIYITENYHWTKPFNIGEEGIDSQTIYLESGEAINCFYISEMPVIFYVFDLNSFSSYINNPVSQTITSMKASNFGFVRFMPSVPGNCWILIMNPVRYYPAFGQITVYKYYAIPAITSNNEYTTCLYLAFLGTIIAALGIAFYIILRRYEKEK